MRRVALSLLCGFALLTAALISPLTAALLAQRSPRVASEVHSAEQARTALDGWIVTRFRGAQLLDDSVATSAGTTESSASAPAPLYPRVESVHETVSGDTLFALHFGTQAGVVPLRDLSMVRLSASSGAISTQEARIISRRAFRAPRLPNARHENAASWRYGWAYLLVTRARRPSQGFRGWLLLTIPDSAAMRGTGRATRKPPGARVPITR